MILVDRDYGDETRGGHGDLCSRCLENAALPDDPDNLCADCVADVEAALAEVEEDEAA